MHEILGIYRPKLAGLRARIHPWRMRDGGLRLHCEGSKAPLPLVEANYGLNLASSG